MKKIVGLILFLSAFLIVNNVFSWFESLVIPSTYTGYFLYVNAFALLLGGFFSMKTLKLRGGKISVIMGFVASILIAAAMFYYGGTLLEGKDGIFFGPTLAFVNVMIGVMQFDFLLISPTNQALIRRR